ncbi:hypothetical protein L6R50_05565 [Myxococcota bacterium]|nr:hypothetical protein [Myxococcota bacterium]
MRQWRVQVGRRALVLGVLAWVLGTGCRGGAGGDAPATGGSRGEAAVAAAAAGSAPAVDPGWQEDAISRIAAGEYRFRAAGEEGYEASNRSQGLVAR